VRECLPCVTGALRSDFCAWPSARDLAWTRQSIDGTWTTRASSGNDRLLVTTDGTRAYGHAVAGDKGYEAYRSFSIRLVGPNLAAAREYRIFVFNEDLHRGRAQFETAATSAVASAGRAVLAVKRVEGTEGDLRFDFATAYGTGQAGRDYAARSGQITLANGAASAALEIPLMSGGGLDADPTFTVTLSGDSLGTPVTNTVTVTHRSSATSDGGGQGGGGTSPLALLVLAIALGLALRVD